jgi:hypothetical protein
VTTFPSEADVCVTCIASSSFAFLETPSFPHQLLRLEILHFHILVKMSRRDPERERSERESRTIPAASRKNEYFLPKEGIDREVLTADLCRYLGNDALVRPGTYEVSVHTSSKLRTHIAKRLTCTCRIHKLVRFNKDTSSQLIEISQA